MVKEFKVAIALLIIGVISSFIIQSCKEVTYANEMNYEWPAGKLHISAVPIVMHPYIKHDTLDTKRMTPAEYQAYLQKFYTDNYNNLFAPVFKKQDAIMATQAQGLATLSSTMRDMRSRYIQVSTAKDKHIAHQDSEILRLNKTIADNGTAVLNEDLALKSGTNVVIGILITLCVLILVAVIVFFRRLRKVEKDVFLLKTELNYE